MKGDLLSLRLEAEAERQVKRERQLRAAYQEFFARMPARSLPVTLVLRQKIVTGVPHWRPQITQDEATKTVRSFLYHIDRAVFKNAARVERWNPTPKRLQRFFVLEWGNLLGIHSHGAIEIPASFDEDDFKALLHKHWRALDGGTRIHFGWDASKRWDAYTLKAKSTGPLADHVDVVNLHIS